jgi:hypothetical protein
MAYNSVVFYTSTGSEMTVAVTFPYLDVTHVNVSFWNPATEVYDLQDRATWSFATSSTVTLTNTDTSTNGIKIWRNTGTTPLVTFTNASLLNEDDQNTAALQAIYLIEEGADYVVLELIDVDTQIDATNTVALTFVVTNDGAAIDAGAKGSLYIPFSCDIVGAYAFGDASGSCVVDIWVDAAANNPPTNADSITASAPITISTATYSADTTLTGWTTHIVAGSVMRFNIDSVDTFTDLTIVVVVTK